MTQYTLLGFAVILLTWWFGRPRRLEATLTRILKKNQEAIMGQLEDLTSALDAETNAVAARLDKLSSDLAAAVAAGQAPKPETLAALSAISDRLKSLGADPATPIPTDPVPAADAAAPDAPPAQ